ncbi:MAG TPA: ABC transporter ATP-binding protein [Coriobacteriia bacterium]|nr:ABC transporter ATP-binding protein [Coriobacteriia bacterium]
MAETGLLVDVRDVRMVFGKKRALDGVNLSVGSGEVVGLVGPNGAGKSTLMRVLSGTSQCTGGSGHVLGTSIGSGRRRVPFVGVMIERPTFVETLDGPSNLRLLAGIRGEIGDDRIDEVLELVGLSAAAKARVRNYSQGMRQRLSLAQAIMERPRLLVLDEPTNGLDPDGIIEMRAILRGQARAVGCGVLISSHLLAEVEAVCDRVVLIERGRVRDEFRPGGTGHARIRLELADARQAHLVSACDGVLSTQEVAQPGQLTIEASIAVPDLVIALVNAGVRVEAIFRHAGRLEDVYRQKVGRDA